MGVSDMPHEATTSDDESFAWFFTAEYPQVVRLLTVVLRDAGAAEDLAQDAFVRLHRHWAKVSRYESPEGWIRRVALNRAFSWQRREGRRWVIERTASPLRDAAPDPMAGRVDVLRAVRSLPPRDRALVALYHLEDRPLAEVAELLGLSTGTAKVALHRARRRLSEMLTEQEANP